MATGSLLEQLLCTYQGVKRARCQDLLGDIAIYRDISFHIVAHTAIGQVFEEIRAALQVLRELGSCRL